MAGEYRKYLEPLYTNKIVEIHNKCVYCSRIATSEDHVPALSILRDLIVGKESTIIKLCELVIVPCCIECNTILGARALFSVETRKRFLHEYYIHHSNRGAGLIYTIKFWPPAFDKIPLDVEIFASMESDLAVNQIWLLHQPSEE